MMSNFNEEPRYSMTYKHKFNGIRYDEQKLIPVKWKLMVELYGPEVDAADEDSQYKKVTVAYHKVIFFCETVLSECLVSSVYTVNEIGGFQNVKIVLPDNQPSDDVFLRVLHSKLSVITEGNMMINKISLYSSDQDLTYHYRHDGFYGLPEQKDFIGDNSLYDTPWWNRNDCDTFDVNDDHESKSAILKNASILTDFGQHMHENFFDDEETAEKQPAEIITVDKWRKPRKV